MRLAYMENFPDKDNIPAYDKFVATHIFPRQLLGSNAFVRGEQLSLSHGDSLDFKDMMKNNFQAVQFYLVDPELLARVIKVYGKRVDFRQKEYENNPDAIFSL